MAEDVNRTWKDQYMLRLPDGMRGRIRAAAEANGRSMNSEIVSTLQEHYPAPKPAADLDAMLSWAEFLGETNDLAELTRRRTLMTEALQRAAQTGDVPLAPGPFLDKSG